MWASRLFEPNGIREPFTVLDLQRGERPATFHFYFASFRALVFSSFLGRIKVIERVIR